MKISTISSMAVFISLLGAAVMPALADQDAKLDVSEWLAAYGVAWETRDADKAASLFTEDATYQDNPYNDAYQGRKGIYDYWSEVTKDQRNVSFDYEVLTAYERTGIAQWSAEFESASSGATINLNGIFLLEFDENGLCSSLREWWHIKVDEPADTSKDDN